MRLRLLLSTIAIVSLLNTRADAQILDHRALLERETWWDNRDFDWYEQNIPFFDCPDRDLTTTYYYRWELLTKHLTYGSPNSGYSFTEFIDRPFWSGAYGAISCPAGLQLYEARWLRDPTIARNYVRYWFRTPGAQPRRYSTWLVDAAWAVHQVHPDGRFIKDLLPDFVRNDQEWEKARFDPSVGLFWQSGHDDGMEYNINSRQTRDPNAGAQGFRPPLNSYMIADARALERVARLAGDEKLAKHYEEKGRRLKEALSKLLWDPKRKFFFHRFRNDEQANGIAVSKNTLTHETGKFAGSPYGRELHGYVPWQFGLFGGDPQAMWNLITNDEGFRAPFGPTTVERRDPMFALNKSCCWWSGQSWPYATSQTLKGMANLLQQAASPTRRKGDYYSTLRTYARTHRKNGRPYIAEACNPFTGSWEGHDAYNHSEHYFHSNFCDLIITGLVGIEPGDGDSLSIKPLAPDDWDYFALDNLRLKGHDVAIIYDRTGTRYGRGQGLMVFVDGKVGARSPTLTDMQADLGHAEEISTPKLRRVNYAVNNDGVYFPRMSASISQPAQGLRKLIDGNYWYHQRPPNRWTFEGTRNTADSITVDLGVERLIDEARLYLLDDIDVTAPPESYTIDYFEDGKWQPVSERTRRPPTPEGRRANRVHLTPIAASKFRFNFTHRASAPTGLSEIELWGDAEGPVAAAPFPPGDLARGGENRSAPKITASYTFGYDRIEHVNDGVVNFEAEPHNRWTSYDSPNNSDWLEFDFGETRSISRVELAIYSDGRGVRPPKSIHIQEWKNDQWSEIEGQTRAPARIVGGELNEIRFPLMTTTKLRFVFEHALPGKSGVSEIYIWKD